MGYFKRRHQKLPPVVAEDAIHYLNPSERRALRRIHHLCVMRAGLVGVTSASVVGFFDVYVFDPSNPITYYLSVGLLTGVLAVFENRLPLLGRAPLRPRSVPRRRARSVRRQRRGGGGGRRGAGPGRARAAEPARARLRGRPAQGGRQAAPSPGQPRVQGQGRRHQLPGEGADPARHGTGADPRAPLLRRGPGDRQLECPGRLEGAARGPHPRPGPERDRRALRDHLRGRRGALPGRARHRGPRRGQLDRCGPATSTRTSSTSWST